MYDRMRRGLALGGRGSRAKGFTLIECTIAIFVLGLVSSSLFLVYSSGMTMLNERSNADQIESVMRSRMEQLLTLEYDWLLDGGELVTIDGSQYSLTWTVSYIDLDGDLDLDSSAKFLVLDLEGNRLETLVFDSKDVVGKI